MMNRKDLQQNESLAVAITPTDTYVLQIQKQIDKELQKILEKHIFTQIAKLLKQKKVKNNNSNDIIIKAIESGQIYYNLKKQAFQGSFSIAIIKTLKEMGGRHDGRKNMIFINLSNLPTNILTVAQSRAVEFQKDVNEVNAILQRGLTAITALGIASLVEPAIKKLLLKTASKMKKDNINTDQEIIDTLMKDYASRIDLKIKDFTNKETKIMREDLINKILYEGNNKQLEEYIQSKYSLSKSRSELIARQETAQVNVALQNDRYTKAGMDEYYWINPDPNNPDRRDGHYILAEQSKKGVRYKIGQNPIDPITGKPTEPSVEFNCNCYKQIIKN